MTGPTQRPGRWEALRTLFSQHRTFITIGMLLSLFVVAHPRIHGRSDSTVSTFIGDLRAPRLSRQDQQRLERGYYENLAADRANVELWNLYRKQPADWRNLWQTDAVHWTGDILGMELKPGILMEYKGSPFSTNQWGMRDQECELAKPPHTIRVAMLGSSPVMGSGVGDQETLDWNLEKLLNGSSRNGEGPLWEVLNFAVDGYTAVQHVHVLTRKVLSFQPDYVFFVAHDTDTEKTAGKIATMIEENQMELLDVEVQELVRDAGVGPGANRAFAAKRLTTIQNDIMLWAYRKMVSRARENGIVPVWIFMPMPAAATRGGSIGLDRSHPRVAELFRLAEEAGFEIVDASGAYDGHELSSLWVAEWDRHPNATGQRLVAQRIFTVLNGEGSPLHPKPNLEATQADDQPTG